MCLLPGTTCPACPPNYNVSSAGCLCPGSSLPLAQVLMGSLCAADACHAAAHDVQGWRAAARNILCLDRCCP